MRAISPSKLLYRPLVTPVMAAWWKGVKQTRVFVAPACNVASKGGTHEYGESNLLLLRHPKSGNRTNFLLRNGSLLEVNWFKQFYGSWFLGDYVSEDGSLHIATPVDPIFVLLPLFEEARMKKAEDRGMFRDLNEIMDVDGYPGYRQLLPIVEGSIQLLCEVKEVGSTKFLRLDDLKVLTWLSIKVRNLKEALSALDKNYAAREEKDTWGLSHVKAVVTEARTITGFIYNHSFLLAAMRRKEYCGGDLIRPGVTRFATHFLALQSLKGKRDGLKKLFAGVEWSSMKESRTTLGAKIEELVNNRSFWDKITNLLKIMEPIVKVLRLVDGDKSPTIPWLYEAIEKLKETIKVVAPRSHAQYLYIIKKRWDNMLMHPLHKAVVDVISLLGEYLKDEPWLKLLCNHLKLDIQDLARRPASGQDSPSFAASAGPNVPFIEEKKNANGKSNQNTGKQPKKLKTQVESKNIKDMFRRVTRRG